MEDPTASANPEAARLGDADRQEDVGEMRTSRMTFEEIMTDLEAATERLATGELGIEAATEIYEEAERLHALATERLAQVQARVDRLTAPDERPPTSLR